jgi:hypothetical protein
MRIAQALDLISCYDSTRNPLTSLGDFINPELVSSCLAESGTVTLRKRRLPLEMMVWCIVGMALEREEPLHQIVNRLDIMLPGKRPFVARAPLFKLANVWAARLSAVFSPKQHNCGITPSRIPTGVA